MKFMIIRPYDGECLSVWEPRGADNTPIDMWPGKLTKKLRAVPGFDQAVVLEQDTEADGKEITELIVSIDLAPPAEDDGLYVRYEYKASDTVHAIHEAVDRMARAQIVK